MLQWLSKNKNLKTAVLFGAVIAAVFLFSGSALAQSIADSNSTLNQGVQIIKQPLGLSGLDIRVIIANIIKVILGLIGLILVVLIIYAGYLWMTAGGNEEQITQAKSVLRNAVIGLAIILSAYAIVAFILNMLGISGGFNGNGDTNAPPIENLAGSGGLGRVIKDHYPARDQKEVPRNTKIVISFFKPILPSSFISDTNSDGIYGDCLTPPVGTDLNWNKDCDHVVTTTAGLLSDDYINVKITSTSQPIAGLVALTSSSSINGVSGVFTLVLKPITDTSTANFSGGYLGSDTDDVGYTVYLGKLLRTDDPLNNNPTLFKRPNGPDVNPDSNTNNYHWNFTCNTTLDLTPPYVTRVFPDTSTLQQDKEEPKNSIIQVSFSEPVDPIGLQGAMQSSSPIGYYFLNSGDNNGLYLNNSSTNILPKGSWNLVNGFKTLEFTPSEQCGKNVCGDPIYCLPVCAPGSSGCDGNKIASYKVLLKTASTTGTGFMDKPFTGVEDLSGNALDGNNNQTRQNPATTLPIFDNWNTPDNYMWNFHIKNNIDLTPPYLFAVAPGLYESSVDSDAMLAMVFSKPMRFEPLYTIDIKEDPLPGNGVPLWKVPYYLEKDVDSFGLISGVLMNHGPFLKVPDKMYMPIVSSSVQDVHFNCFYPGLGPKTIAPAHQQRCDSSNAGTCCAVIDAANANFCCNGSPIAGATGIENCKNISRQNYTVIQ